MPTSRSSSVSSSASDSSINLAENQQIFVKLLTGETIPLSIPSSTSITTLVHLLSLRTSQPLTNLRLVHAGKHLTTPSNTNQSLSSLSIPANSTLHLTVPLRGGAPKKNKCTFKDCKESAQRIVGDCSFCGGKYCGKHRMLEDHKCTGLEDCKKESHERNKEQLERERTVVVKGI